MPKKLIVVVALLSWFCPALAAESINITTYLPSPYATYVELRVDRATVGSAYRGQSLSDGTLLISGRLAIGTSAPVTTLHVRGDRLGGYHTAFFRGTNDIGVGIGGYTTAGGPLSLGSIQAMTYNTSTGQPLLINGFNGGPVSIGPGGTGALGLQLELRCASGATCFGGTLDNANSGPVQFQWCTGSPACSSAAYYGRAVYD